MSRCPLCAQVRPVDAAHACIVQDNPIPYRAPRRGSTLARFRMQFAIEDALKAIEGSECESCKTVRELLLSVTGKAST